MPPRVDLTGRVFGELTVVAFSHSHVQPSGQKRAMWHVRCSCGTAKIMGSSVITSGRTVSCGHVGAANRRLSKLKPFGHAQRTQLYVRYFHSAKNRGLEFLISDTLFDDLINGDCAYCGSPPSNIVRSKSAGRAAKMFNGIDRVDSSVGYIRDNVVSCCWNCNRMKGTLGRDEFLEHIKRIAGYAASHG